MTRCLLALLKTTFHSTELKQRGKGGIKPNPTDEGRWRSSGKKTIASTVKWLRRLLQSQRNETQ